MGVTGSGKTFTMANVIQNVQRPVLVMSHNKTLAAQLYSEFKEFFPHNAVHYFVSYYDYYQPEAYIPQRDIYIEKDASINQQIERLRLAATSALVSRRDVIIVASVSCIYGLGSPEDYRAMMVGLDVGQTVDRDQVLAKLVDIQYERNDIEFQPGKFRVRGDCVEVWPTYEETAFRVEFWGDEVEQLSVINPTSGEVLERPERMFIYPSKHFVLPEERIAGRGRRNQAGTERAAQAVQGPGQAAGGPAAQRPDALRHRDASGGGLLSGHRELQPAAMRASGRLAARHALQFLSRRFSAVCRRVARQRAAGSRHVLRRPQPQGDAGGARLPPAQRVGQPAAAVRGMGGPHQAGDLRLGHARPVRIGEDRRTSASSR